MIGLALALFAAPVGQDIQLVPVRPDRTKVIPMTLFCKRKDGPKFDIVNVQYDGDKNVFVVRLTGDAPGPENISRLFSGKIVLFGGKKTDAGATVVMRPEGADYELTVFIETSKPWWKGKLKLPDSSVLDCERTPDL